MLRKSEKTEAGNIFCSFENDGLQFSAQIARTFGNPNKYECIIFPLENGQVRRFDELYVKPDTLPTEKELLSCVWDFVENHCGKTRQAA